MAGAPDKARDGSWSLQRVQLRQVGEGGRQNKVAIASTTCVNTVPRTSAAVSERRDVDFALCGTM
jgi:hypothetical protein